MGVSSATKVHGLRGGIGGILLASSACFTDDDVLRGDTEPDIDSRADEERVAVAHDGASSVDTSPTTDPAAAPLDDPNARCDGTPLPPCDGPFTGSSCNLPCTHGAEPPLACGLERTCHSDGSTYGISTRNAVLYPASPEDSDDEVHADFEAWIVEHAADLGLDAGLSVDDVELTRLGDFRSSAGPLTLFRFAQTYHGRPVLAPDGIVTLVYAPQGAVAITGAIIDGRTPYAHRDVQASETQAVRSMLAYASTHAHVPVGELEVVYATPVAMLMRKAIGWAGFVRRREGGTTVARVIVDADPTFEGTVLPLWSYREPGVAGLADTQGIEVQAVDVTGDLTSLAYARQTELTTGAPLVGSVDDVSQEIQLADERVVLLDLHGATLNDLAVSATRVLDPGGAFLANAGPELAAQTAYYLFQSWYDFIDARLTDPVAGTKRWHSANLLYSNGTYSGDTPPGTYSPRVLAFSNANPVDCDVNATACTTYSGYEQGRPEVMVFPELAHVPPGASKQETTGSILLLNTTSQPVTLAHEFGHIVDLFTGGGITDDFVTNCGGTCAPECLEGTTDEAPPLTESIAQLLAFVLLHQSFDGVEWQHCSIVDLVSRNGSKPWTPGPCIPAGEDISVFQRPAACSKEAEYCDEPEDPGFEPECCYDDEDLSDCTLVVPVQCPMGAPGMAGGVGTGTARAVPTGLCEAREGYATNSLFQAFWQLLNGQRCEPTPPFACVSAAWPPGVDPTEATTDTLLYAMRVNSLSYDALFEAMAVYVSCTYGPDAYAEFNAITCNHGIRDCALPPPMACESCGNGVREGGESCDGSEWLYASCSDLPQYSGGTLTCDQATCVLDESQCTMPGLDTTAGSMPPSESTTNATEPETDTDTEPGAAGSQSDGCDCRALGSSAGWFVLFPLSLLGATRRRRAA